MRKLRYIAAAVGVAAAAAVFTAPTAVAADGTEGCTKTGTATVCDNTQLDATPPVYFGPQYPYWGGDDDPGIIGGFGGHGVGGWGFGGGHGFGGGGLGGGHGFGGGGGHR